MQISRTGYHFDQTWLYDVMALVKILKILENRLYFWIPLPEISLDSYFQLFNSIITLLDIEFDLIFPVFDQM